MPDLLERERTREEIARTLQQIPQTLQDQLGQLGFGPSGDRGGPQIPLDLMRQMLPGLLEQQQTRSAAQRLNNVRGDFFVGGDIEAALRGGLGNQGLRTIGEARAPAEVDIKGITRAAYEADIISRSAALHVLTGSEVNAIDKGKDDLTGIISSDNPNFLKDAQALQEVSELAQVFPLNQNLQPAQRTAKLTIEILRQNDITVDEIITGLESILEAPHKEQVDKMILLKGKRETLSPAKQEKVDFWVQQMLGSSLGKDVTFDNIPSRNLFRNVPFEILKRRFEGILSPRQEEGFTMEEGFTIEDLGETPPSIPSERPVYGKSHEEILKQLFTITPDTRGRR